MCIHSNEWKGMVINVATMSIVIGIIFMVYFFIIEFFTGHGTNFYFIWLIMGIFLVLFGVLSRRGLVECLPKWIKMVTGFLFLLGLVLFLIVEGLVVSHSFKKGVEDLDYIIVLGAQLKENGPSKVLQYRLDEAYQYLSENENTVAIVSGGKGSNEPDTEAQGMYDYLVKKGIDANRILKEDTSINTSQNISNSSKFIDIENDKIGIITNNFHVFRALSIAKTAGYVHVYGIAAPSYLFMQPNNMLREFFGIVKDFMVGNI